MTTSKSNDISIQSYFEARSNIRELEQRQFGIIQYFLGAFAGVMGGSIALMQYVDNADRYFLAISFVLVSNILSVSLFFLWCSVTLMINRAALFCVDIIDNNHDDQRDVIWETWLRGKRNKSSSPNLIESTLLVFLFPLIATFLLSLYIGSEGFSHFLINFLVNLLPTIFGVSLLLFQFKWVLRDVVSTWTNSESAKDGA